MKNPWSNRWRFVKDYIPNNVSIVDFGCGNKEVLDYITPTDYVGVDCNEPADVIANLNQKIILDKKFDTALLLGVLEYVDDPDYTLSNIVEYSDNFIVLSLIANKKKREWKQLFSDLRIDLILRKYFNTVDHHRHGRYLLSVCNK